MVRSVTASPALQSSSLSILEALLGAGCVNLTPELKLLLELECQRLPNERFLQDKPNVSDHLFSSITDEQLKDAENVWAVLKCLIVEKDGRLTVDAEAWSSMRFGNSQLGASCPCVAFLVLVAEARLSQEPTFHCGYIHPDICATDTYLQLLKKFAGLGQECSVSDLTEAHESLVKSLEAVLTERLVLNAIAANQRARAMTSATATPVFWATVDTRKTKYPDPFDLLSSLRQLLYKIDVSPLKTAKILFPLSGPTSRLVKDCEQWKESLSKIKIKPNKERKLSARLAEFLVATSANASEFGDLELHRSKMVKEWLEVRLFEEAWLDSMLREGQLSNKSRAETSPGVLEPISLP
eukprot:Gregarina_sp_Poly_1__10872@NODE_846_length_5999_cov_216_429872_g611_i0_p2_GENE_NODE_846_length_5999_cov_216_429872_g611_i0NODE_846_length_5999_cov_216_429872_g611_i0_p2_ORF_typecomplete_len353_score41_12_NODE_846_length_5999_cov_216_429872_g611_i05601618